MKFFQYICFILFIAQPMSLWAQESKYLDDKPRDTYNAGTTLFITQANIQYNLGGYRAINDDLSISKFHRFTLVQQHSNLLQDLGNHGTAVKPIFYTIPEVIGLHSGFYVYDYYFHSPDRFRYYNTKSPYTKFNVTLAHFFKDLTDNDGDVCYSHNITPFWNVGFNLRMLGTGKGRLSTNSKASNVHSEALDFFTHYKTEDERYQILGHIGGGKHRVNETGGISQQNLPQKSLKNPKSILYYPINIRATINDDRASIDTRKRIHLYQQLSIAEQLWMYHKAEGQSVDNFFGNPAPPAYRNPEKQQRKPLGPTNHGWSVYNEVGLKTDRKNLFGSGHYRHRYITLQQSEAPPKNNTIGQPQTPTRKEVMERRHEHYVGFRARYHLEDQANFFYINGNYLLQDGKQLLPGLHKTTMGYQGGRFKLSYDRVSYQPSLLAQSHSATSLSPPTATQLQGSVLLRHHDIYLKPHIGFTRVHKHIYFDQNCTPKQDQQYVDLIKGGTDFRFMLNSNFCWDGELTAAQTLGPSATILQIPNCILNTRLYYANTNEKGNGAVECGVDMHWKSNYYADNYDYEKQQFYLQNSFEVYSYPILDLFVNFRIKHLSMFFKFSHWNEYFYLRGYFVTPYYPGPHKAFNMGVKWHFFD